MHWLGALLLSTYWPESGKGNAFFASFGSVLIPPLITLAGAALLYALHNRCHGRSGRWRPCLRIVRHVPEGGGKRYCRHHQRPAPVVLAAPQRPPACCGHGDLDRRFETLHADISDLAVTLRALLLSQQPARTKTGRQP